ncbi:ParA family protein [Legionella spiritensis]|uniref:CobQ/CobB/MinD/ParA nucleotide binding domain protein n=1 Tax=Legionella spiritensis TaxID=452 RepID=A0A0W0Z5Q4_LEGSP|nr:ParA family protein [Legionella spiritensis]KTD64489.1 CobQ/CobB/MinD/ParA nucleotide binding domain protein [Legionella spiritensis]SNV45569.1 plasmid-partitioning protein RepA [Legionella spiritensis]
MMIYAFWNNKGGTGKTSLSFQTICNYAETFSDKRILAIDLCPQANLSELLLGGLTEKGSDKLLQQQGLTPRCSIGGYFQLRLPSPYAIPNFTSEDFISKPNIFNDAIADNIDLVCGDPLLELQSNAVNTLANQQIPGTNTWITVIDWLKDFLENILEPYDMVFIDCNPSFSLYTQIALASAKRIILPVMADDSSRRAIQNAFSLIYGLKLPSEIYSTYAFSAKLKNAERALPKIHLIVKNRLTQYMGPASAYDAVLNNIKNDISVLLKGTPNIFTAENIDECFIDVRDFQTAGVIAFARGLPFSKLKAGKQTVNGHRVQVKEEYRINCLAAIKNLVSHIGNP